MGVAANKSLQATRQDAVLQPDAGKFRRACLS